MTMIQELKQPRSLSPLNKDPYKVGKLFNRSKLTPFEQNPEQTTPAFTSSQPKEIGVNTSKIGIEYSPEIEIITKKQSDLQMMEDVRPSIKLHSSVFQLKFNSAHIGNQSKQRNNKLQKSPVGTIRRQPKSAPKDYTTGSQTFSHLPSINKIQKNVSGFRSFVDTSVGSPSIGQKINKNNNLKSRGDTRVSSFRKSRNLDSQQNDILSRYQYSRPSNNSRIKLPTFKDESKSQYNIPFQDTSKSYNFQEKSQRKTQNNNKNHGQPIEQVDPLTHSQLPESHDLPHFHHNNSNSFVLSRVNPKSDTHVSIDLRTSISKIKQILVQCGDELHASFIVPQIFFNPPSSTSTSQELHMLMLEAFSHIGITPQIVSIKKYVNCVVLREKNLSIVWNFNGKIYFGGWKRGDNLSQGNKHGIGIEWVPSRYIFYGEFKDNKKDGYGIMKKSNKEVYIGCWKNNQRWGWGKLYDSQGHLHQNGEFMEGCFVAADQQTYAKNSRIHY